MNDTTKDENESPTINPANGQPMANDAIDVIGNPYGTCENEWHSNDDFFNHDLDGFDTSFPDSDFNW